MLNLPLSIVSEDNKEYTLLPWQPVVEDIIELWSKYSKYKVLFSDVVVNNPQQFCSIILAPTTIVLLVKQEGKDVGLLYITDIRPLHSADAHYFFWDRKTDGRQRLILVAMRWAMDEFKLHRLNSAIPITAYSALHRVRRIGMYLEGRKRQSIRIQGKWLDTLLFSVIREEITEEAIEKAYIERPSFEYRWFNLLRNNYDLMHHIVNRRTRDGDGPEGNGDRSSKSEHAAIA
jgi:hypothetical protein